MTLPALQVMTGRSLEQQKADEKHNQKALKQLLELIKTTEKQLEALKALASTIARGHSSADAIRVEYVSLWESKLQTPYLGSYARDLGIIRNLRKKLSDNDIRERLTRFFADDDSYNQRDAWTLQLFAHRINSYASGIWRTRARRSGAGGQTNDADLFETALQERREGRG